MLTHWSYIFLALIHRYIFLGVHWLWEMSSKHYINLCFQKFWNFSYQLCTSEWCYIELQWNLSHWEPNSMINILRRHFRMIFLNDNYCILFKFHWSLSLNVQLKIIQHCCRLWTGTGWQTIIWTNDDHNPYGMNYGDWVSLLERHRDHIVYAPSQWETTLHCNVVSYWLGAYTKLSP